MKQPQPNQEQLAAVLAFAKKEGRTWKSTLTNCWLKAGYPGHQGYSHLLQQVRNQFGPRWLEGITYADLERLAGQTAPQEDEAYACPLHGKQDGPDCARC